MLLVLAALTCQLRDGFLRLFMTHADARKYRGLALNATRTLRSPSCVEHTTACSHARVVRFTPSGAGVYTECTIVRVERRGAQPCLGPLFQNAKAIRRSRLLILCRYDGA